MMLALGLIDAKTKLVSQSLDLVATRALTASFSWNSLSPTLLVLAAPSASPAEAALASASDDWPEFSAEDYDSSGQVKSLGRRLNAAKFGDDQWPALNALWTHESGWRPNARNPRSGACGIPQALPCRKITNISPGGQISWGLDYIASRYGTPANAWAFWQRHHWY